MRRKLVAGNWKMNGNIVANASLLAGIEAEIANAVCDIAVCVPFPYLAQCQALLVDSRLMLGAQDISTHDSGAYTGEVSASMLQEFNCRFVIVGHSERRAYFGETDELIARKTIAAIGKGLVPIVCVGETLEQREAGRTDEVVARQIDAVLSMMRASDLEKIVVAYEPVWAIGTGRTATPEMAQAVHAMLRERLKQKDSAAAMHVRILYGGSMKPDNAQALLAMADIDGGLIGGAALKAQDFLAIIHAACAAG